MSDDARWRHQVAGALQLFVGRCLDADPAYFLRSVRLLARDLPVAPTYAHRDLLRKEALESAARACQHFHAEYHRTIDAADCPSAPMSTLSILWAHQNLDASLLLRLWASAFLEDFNATHPWPAAVHAAIVLRKQRRRWVRIEQLCFRLGVSKTALSRSFRHLYRISPTDYHRRTKMRWAVAQLLESGVCVEAIALGAGYRSIGSFYETCWSLTGLSPAQIRRLPPDNVRNLLDSSLSLRMVRLTDLPAAAGERLAARPDAIS